MTAEAPDEEAERHAFAMTVDPRRYAAGLTDLMDILDRLGRGAPAA